MTAADLAVAAADSRRDMPAAARVTRLVLTDFRNFARLRLTPGPAPVVLTGANGAGKTNLLEALSFLGPGRGLRRARLAEVTRRQAPAAARWAVSVRLALPQGESDIGTGLDDAPGGAGERRALRIDGTNVRDQAALGERLGVCWLTPAMDRLLNDAPVGRRRFLDRMVAGLVPGHGRRLAAYERAIRERGRLLAGGGDRRWLAALEETAAGHGVAVAAARREAVASLEAALAAAAGPFPRPGLALVGDTEGWLDEMAAVDAEHRLAEALRNARGRDAERGGSAHGPHRSDLAVTHLDRGVAAAECSTGEQKALLVAIVLAEARLRAVRLGAAPLVLLDEVMAHLDGARRAALVEALLGLGAQAWLTGTDAGLFAALAGRAGFFTVADGTVTPTPLLEHP